MVTLRFILGLAVLIFLVTFALLNMEPSVTLRYFFGYAFGPVPLFFALLSAGALGMMTAMVFSIFEQFRLRAVIRKQKRQVAALKRELQEYHDLMPENQIEKTLSQKYD
ncbi:MAG: LapA family protein [Nitrospinae bacterium]|nr:LapA family protein [Nitrospinota bacterium]